MLEQDICKVHFYCPECNKEYICYYTNEKIKAKQAEIRELVKRQRGNRGNKDTILAAKLNKRYRKLKKEVKGEMDRLKVRIEGR